MSVTSTSPRHSPRAAFECNVMYAPRTVTQVRPPQQHTNPHQPSQIYHIPPTPEGGQLPRTPNFGASHPGTKQQQGSSSPSTGYFGLAKDEDDTHISANWSAGSSIRSAAARSPMVFDMDSVPNPSEDFRKQHKALSLKAIQSKQRLKIDQEEYSKLQTAKRDSADNKHEKPDGKTANHVPDLAGLQRFDSPQPFSGPVAGNVGVIGGPRSQSLSMASSKSGPTGSSTEGDEIIKGHTRAATMPISAQVDGISLMYASKVANLLDSSPESVLILDLRQYASYSQSRIEGAINISVPTTLLKRPSFNIAKLADSLGGAGMKKRFLKWKSAKYIVVYDATSATVKESLTASHTVHKFTREGWTGEAFLLSGGFDDFYPSFSEKVDKSPIREEGRSGRSFSLSARNEAGAAKPSFNCPLPATKSAANPFFSNIRQNTDLIDGVGEMPVKLPSSLTPEAKNRLPKWLKEVINTEDGSKKISERFLKLEKAEQKRMQDALSMKVSYGEQPDEQPHTLAGVEKGAKNRYNNIYPYEHSRVKLEGKAEGTCDYVNASYVSTEYCSKRYIATQGPLPATFGDFWSVVWDQDVRVIVMLTAESEGGLLKCHSYWKEQSYGALRLTSLSEKRVALDINARRASESAIRHGPMSPGSVKDDVPFVVMRKFTLSHSSHPFEPIREITQLQYSSWPDFGTPASPLHILSLIDQTNMVVRATSGANKFERPIIVHCSAGCGRTGTFCTTDSVIDMLRHQFEARTFTKVDKEGDSVMADDDWVYNDDQDLVAKAVADLRYQRLSMVQSLRQFVLCYETIIEWLLQNQH